VRTEKTVKENQIFKSVSSPPCAGFFVSSRSPGDREKNHEWQLNRGNLQGEVKESMDKDKEKSEEGDAGGDLLMR